MTRLPFTPESDITGSNVPFIGESIDDEEEAMRERSASMPSRNLRKAEKWVNNDEDDEFLLELGIDRMEMWMRWSKKKIMMFLKRKCSVSQKLIMKSTVRMAILGLTFFILTAKA
eukprot:IDg9251t1